MMSVFEALSEPHRRVLLEVLASGERTVTDLMAEVGLSQSATSKHLKVLREAGLVEVRGDGQRRYYRLHGAALAEVDRWVARFRPFWADRLDALGTYLENDES